MNLVAIEYMFVRSLGSGGALVISEFAGAAKFFKTAQIVNPWDIEQTSKSINYALVQSSKNDVSTTENVGQYSAQNWAHKFLRQLSPNLQIPL